jgi:hypothetical protein
MKVPLGHFALSSSCSTGSTVGTVALWPLLHRIGAGDRPRARWRLLQLIRRNMETSLGLQPPLGRSPWALVR